MWKVKNSLSSVFLEKDKLDDKKMGYGAIQGMVAALDDPYTVFLKIKKIRRALNKNSIFT